MRIATVVFAMLLRAGVVAAQTPVVVSSACTATSFSHGTIWVAKDTKNFCAHTFQKFGEQQWFASTMQSVVGAKSFPTRAEAEAWAAAQTYTPIVIRN